MIADRADVIVRQLAVALDEVVAHGADIALDRLLDLGNDVLEVLLAVLAQGAYKVVGHFTSLVEVAADLADVALALSRSGIFLGLYVSMVISVGAAGSVGQNLCLNNVCNVKHLSFNVNDVDYLTGENCVGIFRDIGYAVCHAVKIVKVCKLVNIASALEAEVLEQAVGSVLGEDRDIEFSCLCDHVAGVVFLDDGNRDLLGVACCDLACGVYDAAVVLAADIRGEDLNAVAELVECGVVNVKRLTDRLCRGFKYGERGTDIRGDGIGKRIKLCQLCLGDVGLERNGLADKLGAAQL